MTFSLAVIVFFISSILPSTSETLVGHIPVTAKDGSSIVFDVPFQVEQTTTGNVVLSLEPNEFSKEFALFPSVVASGQTISVVLKHRHALHRNKNITLEIRGLSEVTGESEVKSVAIIADSFDRPLPQLVKQLFETECPSLSERTKILTMGMTSPGSDESDFVFSLFGPFSERFSIQVSRNEIELWANECLTEQCLKVPRTVALILRVLDSAYTASSHQYQIVVRFVRTDTLSPKFNQDVYYVDVAENAPMLEQMVHLEASDADSDELVYSLGITLLVVPLPYFKKPEWLTVDSLGETFNLTALVSDGKNKPDTATIVVNLMRKPPVEGIEMIEFEKQVYEFTVEPGTTYVGHVGVLSEKDVVYRISEGGAGVFSVDSQNGTLSYTSALQQETQNYTLKLTATSVGHNPKVGMCIATVVIKGIGSVPAKFSSHLAQHISIDQATPMSTVVHTYEAEDPDEGAMLRYSVSGVEVFDILGNRIPESQMLAEYFVFANEGVQNGSLVLAQPIFDVNLMSFHLSISVYDASHPLEGADYVSLIIWIVPVEMLMKPEQMVAASRLQSEIVLPDTLPVGSFVYMMTVNQAPAILRHDDEITFSLVNDRHFFSINKTTGTITTIAPLNGITSTSLVVTSIHTRSQTSSTATISVKVVPVLNAAPRFEQLSYELAVPENKEANVEVGRIRAIDDDELTYSIIDGPNSQGIVAVSNKGVIKFVSSVDREQISEVMFFLKANDSTGGVAVVPVRIDIIDENDNEPSFRQTSFAMTVMENSPIGTFIAKLEVYDPDNDNLTFSLMMNGLSDRLAAALHVDPLGRIVTAQTLLGLDGKYQFAGIVTDGKNSASVPISLSISATSRCQPIFPQNQSIVFFINENNGKFEKIGRIQAETSIGCALFYSFWNAETEEYVNVTDKFTIDGESGEITVVRPLDAEESDRYMLITSAESGGLFALKAVEIRVEDVDDNIPMFVEKNLTVEVFENESVGKVIARLQAEDPDELDTVYYRLRDSHGGLFTIDERSGVLQLVQELDREKTNEYQLHILASNSPNLREDDRFDESVVTVHVADINDNGPLFSQQLYTVLVETTAESGHYLTTVRARDPDSSSDENAVTYFIDTVTFNYKGHARPVQRIFNINERTGDLTLGQSVKDFVGGRFHVGLMSADSADKNANLGHATVQVFVYDQSEVVLFSVDQSVLSIDTAFLEDISK
uniref:Cadherin domain-containing protein n=1 Tax=Steinernema glaseri TaxID=37863 RepID=A0A1I7Y639_9BILA